MCSTELCLHKRRQTFQSSVWVEDSIFNIFLSSKVKLVATLKWCQWLACTSLKIFAKNKKELETFIQIVKICEDIGNCHWERYNAGNEEKRQKKELNYPTGKSSRHPMERIATSTWAFLREIQWSRKGVRKKFEKYSSENMKNIINIF